MYHFVSLKYFSSRQILGMVKLAEDIKKRPGRYSAALKGKCVGIIFQKPSLRTKSAFYVGTLQLGAHPVYYAPGEVKLGEREATSDVAGNLSRFLDAVVLRTYSHKTILDFVQHSSIPVINGLSDLLHPSQVLADIMTIKQFKPSFKKLKVAYIGDGNNVCHCLMYAFSMLGGQLWVAHPRRYAPDTSITQESKQFCFLTGGKIVLTESAREAAHDADVLYTDVWTSMGQEKEAAKRLKVFKDFQINKKLVALAKPDSIVMHCLPAHRGQEITDDVLDGPHSVVFDQAENRLHTAKAILVYLLKDGK